MMWWIVAVRRHLDVPLETRSIWKVSNQVAELAPKDGKRLRDAGSDYALNFGLNLEVKW